MINKSNRILKYITGPKVKKKNRFESKSAAMPCFSAAILAIKTVFSLKIVNSINLNVRFKYLLFSFLMALSRDDETNNSKGTEHG